MWELCICFESRDIAEDFARSISIYVRERLGLVIVAYPVHFASVVIALPLKCKEEANIYFKQKIAEYVLSIYKREYILNHLDFENSQSLSMKVFLQTLVCFDSEMDKQIIADSIILRDKFCVDSFVNFRLSFIKKKWNEVVSLANENIMYLLSEDSFLEFTRFLISNLDHRCPAVNIFSKKNCYFLCDMEGNGIDDFLVEKPIVYDDGKLITSLIALNPEKIILHCNPFVKEPLLRTLFSYFNDRIEVCK